MTIFEIYFFGYNYCICFRDFKNDSNEKNDLELIRSKIDNKTIF